MRGKVGSIVGRGIRYVLVACLFAVSVLLGSVAEGAERILFIPHDNRPISMGQTAEVMEQTGCEVVMPPEELLSCGVDAPGKPEALWAWLEENAPSVRAAVISTDSMLYGGLIASRKHEIPWEDIHGRVLRFRKLRETHPGLSLYLFGSLMRTPRSGLYSGNEEPEYYKEHGADIFRYTALADKAELERLSGREKREMEETQGRIPPGVLEDWMSRRAKNLAATKELVDLAGHGVVRCFLVGRDDNAPLCQTHRENRALKAYAEEKNVPGSRFKSMAGIDEFNLLLLTRAVNDLRHEIPFVCVRYNLGTGAATVPAYSDEPIGASLRDSIALAGGLSVPRPERADFVLLVNTDPRGRTGEANVNTRGAGPVVNDGRDREGTAYFHGLVKSCLGEGYPVGIADIAFANGADNALLEMLRREGLLMKLRAYGGWNTATNSAGFALGTGMLAPRMTEMGRKRLLLRRYLDDWAYQANVRTVSGNRLWEEGRGEAYACLGSFRSEMEERVTTLLREFAEKNLPPFEGLQGMRVGFPWNRMFECEIFFGGGAESTRTPGE